MINMRVKKGCTDLCGLTFAPEMEKYEGQVLTFEGIDYQGRYKFRTTERGEGEKYWYFHHDWLEPVEEVAAPTKETTESRPTLLALPKESANGKVFTSNNKICSKPISTKILRIKDSNIESMKKYNGIITDFNLYLTNDNKHVMYETNINGESLVFKAEELEEIPIIVKDGEKGIRYNPEDPVYSPKHYHFSEYEPVKVIQAWDLSFCLGNVVKYIARAGRKDSSKLIEDLEKAKRYIELELEYLRGKV